MFQKSATVLETCEVQAENSSEASHDVQCLNVRGQARSAPTNDTDKNITILLTLL
jgi:hypothetical protein